MVKCMQDFLCHRCIERTRVLIGSSDNLQYVTSHCLANRITHTCSLSMHFYNAENLHLCTTIVITSWFYKYLVKYEIYCEVDVILPSKILKKFIIEVCVLIIGLISLALLIIFCPISVLVLMYRHLRSN